MTYVSKGGPRTQQGKAASSKNATKIGVYSNTLMPGESQEEVDELIESMSEAYDSDDADSQMMYRSYAQTLIKSRRIQEAEIAFIEAQMHLQDNRREFCLQANIPGHYRDGVPDWFFFDDKQAKAAAMQCGMSVHEALDLKKNYSLQLSQSARSYYPNLWKEVMGPQAINPKQGLGERLQALYNTGHPLSNLQAFVDDYKNTHPYELMWVSHWRRYEAVLDGLRAKAILDVCSRSDWVKVENLQHRRRMEITQALLAKQKLQALEVSAQSVTQAQHATALTLNASADESNVGDVVIEEQHEPVSSQSDKR